MAEARVTFVADEAEAEIVCGLLRAEGIACGYRLAPGSVFGSDSAAGPFASRREVIVDEADLPRARELVDAAGALEATCVECGRPIGDNGRWYSDGTGDLVPYCAACAEREFGPAA